MPDDTPDKRQRNCQSERAVQTDGRKPDSCTNNRQEFDVQKSVKAEGGKSESCTNKRQGADVQKQCEEDNMPEQSVIPNQKVKGINNNEI